MNAVFVAAVIAACVVVAEWLCRRTWLRHAGTALMVIIVTAVVSNAGVIPTTMHPVYEGVFAYVAPVSIFWLLLTVDLRRVLDAGLPLLGLFMLGAAGTVLGVLAGIGIVGTDAFGDQSPALAGMFAATYIGGSANFNALALHYGLVEQGPLYAGAMAVDSGLTALWMGATIVLPRFLGSAPRDAVSPAKAATASARDEVDPDQQSVDPNDIAVLMTLGLGVVWGSAELATVLAARGIEIPSILILTVVALALAQVPAVASLRGTRPLAMFAIYVFLAVIGALCDVGALASLGDVGWKIAVLALSCITVHGVVIFGVGRLLGLDPVLAAVASQANIGGGTTALALARGLGRADLVLPAILVGSVGTALGTFVGFSLAGLLAG